MFTGIVDHCGVIIDINETPTSISLTIKSQFTDLTLGESIAVDGACLTVSGIKDDCFQVEISPETKRLTFASTYQLNAMVNLERSLRLIDRLGGHFVTGHIDGLGEVSRIKPHNEFIELQFNGCSRDAKPYLTKKGSVAVNGVSLTINEVEEDNFSVMLIPHTLQRTNLAELKIDDKVNIEFDYLAKLVFNQLKSGQQ